MRSATEFPMLAGLGLYAAEIRGDGNCLFNALSDQMYGHQGEHSAIRAKVIAYMRENHTFFKNYMPVNEGGGARRNPKRKNAGAFSTPINNTPPTADEVEKAFAEHLRAMAKGGTYGDNMEITAFSSAYLVDVKIYQRDFAYMVHGESAEDEGQERQILHIAYHTWEHFSSIRNLAGPHTGVPNVQLKSLTKEEEKNQQGKLADAPHMQPWMLEAVMTSLPFLADEKSVKKALEESKGNVDVAVSKLLDAKSRSNSPSTPGGSSVERDASSDNEGTDGPNKRQDRRLSRATRNKKKKSPKAPNPFLLRLAANSSQESLSSDGLPLADPNSDSSDSESKPDWHMESFYQGDYNPPTVPLDQRIPSRVKITLKNPQSSSSRKTAPRQTGPQRRKLPSAREKKDIKKKEQKAARRERAVAESKGLTPDNVKKGVSIMTKTKKPSPGLDDGFKILYI